MTDFFLRWLPQSAFPYPMKEAEEPTGIYQHHRRRAMEYTTWFDSTELVGYMVRSPLSNHNWAYRARVKTFNAKEMDEKLKGAFHSGLLWTVSGALYFGLGWDWRTMLWILGIPVAVTEGLSYFQDVAFRQLCPQDDKAKWQAKVQDLVNAGDSQMVQRANQENGDIEFLAGKMHHEYWVDNIPRLQGISLVYSATGGAALNRFISKGGYKQSYLMIALGLLAMYPLVAITNTYLEAKDKVQAGGSQVSHAAHLLGALIGYYTSYFLA